jgi:hypothetical protein
MPIGRRRTACGTLEARLVPRCKNQCRRGSPGPHSDGRPRALSRRRPYGGGAAGAPDLRRQRGHRVSCRRQSRSPVAAAVPRVRCLSIAKTISLGDRIHAAKGSPAPRWGRAGWGCCRNSITIETKSLRSQECFLFAPIRRTLSSFLGSLTGRSLWVSHATSHDACAEVTPTQPSPIKGEDFTMSLT